MKDNLSSSKSPLQTSQNQTVPSYFAQSNARPRQHTTERICASTKIAHGINLKGLCFASHQTEAWVLLVLFLTYIPCCSQHYKTTIHSNLLSDPQHQESGTVSIERQLPVPEEVVWWTHSLNSQSQHFPPGPYPALGLAQSFRKRFLRNCFPHIIVFLRIKGFYVKVGGKQGTLPVKCLRRFSV